MIKALIIRHLGGVGVRVKSVVIEIFGFFYKSLNALLPLGFGRLMNRERSAARFGVLNSVVPVGTSANLDLYRSVIGSAVGHSSTFNIALGACPLGWSLDPLSTEVCVLTFPVILV